MVQGGDIDGDGGRVPDLSDDISGFFKDEYLNISH